MGLSWQEPRRKGCQPSGLNGHTWGGGCSTFRNCVSKLRSLSPWCQLVLLGGLENIPRPSPSFCFCSALTQPTSFCVLICWPGRKLLTGELNGLFVLSQSLQFSVYLHDYLVSVFFTMLWTPWRKFLFFHNGLNEWQIMMICQVL